MAQAPTFRIEARTIAELGGFVEGFRADATRLLNHRFERTVASEAARHIDECRIGACLRKPDRSPMRDAVASVRKSFSDSYDNPTPAVDFDCEVSLFFAEGAVLARFDHGNDDYLKIFAARTGVAACDFDLNGKRPSAVTVKEWQLRERLWASAFGPDKASKLGAGLLFHLVNGSIPAPKWTSVKRAIPSQEVRVRRTARLLAWGEKTGSFEPPDAEQSAWFRRWLSSREGVTAYDDARRRVIEAIPGEIGRDELARYGARGPLRKRSVLEQADPPKPVDHGDVYEVSDGRIFIVVWDAGFKAAERVHIQVNGDQASFVQSGVHFGTIQTIPHAALDLLRGASDATIVEMRRLGDRKEVKAKHVAIVRNTSISDGLDAALTRWRGAASSPAKEETWAE